MLDNTQTTEEDSIESQSSAQAWTYPIFSRLLAATIDYSLWFISFRYISALGLFSYDLLFFNTVITGFLYFTIANSWVCRGTTVGKLLMGLRTRNPKTKGFLSIPQSAFRFFCSHGIIIILFELPEIYFRSQASTSWLAHSNIQSFIASGLYLASLGIFIAHPTKRALHDFISNSIVIRQTTVDSTETSSSQVTYNTTRSTYIGAICGIIFAFVLWQMSLTRPILESQISNRKYLIESKLPVRLRSISVTNNSAQLQATIIKQDKEQLSHLKIAEKLASEIYDSPSFDDQVISSGSFLFYDISKMEIVEFEVDFTSLKVKQTKSNGKATGKQSS